MTPIYGEIKERNFTFSVEIGASFMWQTMSCVS